MPKKRIIKSDDDTVLWQRVTTEIRPLKSTIEAAEFATLFARPAVEISSPSKAPARTSAKTSAAPARPQRGLVVNPSGSGSKLNPVDLRQGDRAGIDGRTQRRLFRGEVPVDQRHDLHGLSAASAESRLTKFIETAANDGARCVLVITGKGAGILRGYVPEWLKRPPLSGLVLALAEARPIDGGDGALYVLLRRNRGGQ